MKKNYEGVIRQLVDEKGGERRRRAPVIYVQYVVGRQQRMGYTGLRTESIGSVIDAQDVR